jgi:hypothetical protein
MEIIKRYQEQYSEFADLNDFNLEERAKRVPAEKHFWVCRLIDAKIEKDRLIKQKDATKSQLVDKVVSESPVKLNKQIVGDIDDAPSLKALNQKIREHDFLIEYLTKVVDLITYISQDIKNITEIKKLQET